MRPKHPNPQPPDPFKPKMRLPDYCSRYGISRTTGLRWIQDDRIAAEQPGGPGSMWFIWLEREEDDDGMGEAMLLQEIQDASQAA